MKNDGQSLVRAADEQQLDVGRNRLSGMMTGLVIMASCSLVTVSQVVAQSWQFNADERLQFDGVVVDEGDPAVFTIQVPEKLPYAVRWQYRTEDGSATVGIDYTAVRGTLQFEVGERRKSITVATIADETAEVIPEFFQLELTDLEILEDGENWSLPGYIPGLPEYAATMGLIREQSVSRDAPDSPSAEQEDSAETDAEQEGTAEPKLVPNEPSSNPDEDTEDDSVAGANG